MYFPIEALQGNINANPYKYWLARRISEHKRMNLGKSNEDVISVKTLIEACPNYPKYEDVRESNRRLTHRLIKPFERAMNTLIGAFSWDYCKDHPKNYEEFISAKVKITWIN